MRFPASARPGPNPTLRFPLTLLLGAGLACSSAAQAQLWQTPQATAKQSILKGFTVTGNVLRKNETAYTLDVVAGRVVGVLVETTNTADLARGFGAAWGMEEKDLPELQKNLSSPEMLIAAFRGIVETADESGTNLLALRRDGLRWKAYLTLNVLPESTFASSANVTGQASAPNVIHLMSDFQCPYCQDLWLGDLAGWRKQPGQYRVVYHQFPLDFHKNAFAAAEASECAAAQGKFWPYSDRLFGRFGEWSRLNTAQASEKFAAYATEGRLNVAAFKTCLSTHAPQAEIKRQLKSKDTAFVDGTPTVYLNGIKLLERSPEEQQAVLAVTRATPSAGTVIEERLKAFR